jgi:hypothetical protein
MSGCYGIGRFVLQKQDKWHVVMRHVIKVPCIRNYIETHAECINDTIKEKCNVLNFKIMKYILRKIVFKLEVDYTMEKKLYNCDRSAW